MSPESRAPSAARRPLLGLVLAAALAAVALAVATASAHAAASFLPPVSYPAAAGTHDVAVGDVNGDGKLDLVTANGADQSISVLFGNGDGTFQAPVTVAIGKTPETVDVGDFDGDGNPDVVVALPNDNQAIVYWGNGTSTPFSAPSTTTLPTQNDPLDAVAIDLNGDGRDDVVTANYHAQGIQAFLSNAGRTFTAGAAPLVGNGPNTLAAGSVFTSADIMVTNRDGGNMRAMPGDGSGGFQVGATYGVGRVTPDDSGLGAPSAVAIGDVNGDGRPDAVTSNFGTNSATALYNTGSGFFTIQQNTVMPTSAAPSGIAAADFTADGRADAEVVDSGLDSVTVTQWGGATNLPMTTVGTYPAGSGLTRDVAGDFNGDGTPDLAIASTDGAVRVLMSRGHPSLPGQAPGSVAVGGALTDQATLTGGTADATGTITFKLYGPGDTTCASPLSTQTTAVAGNHAYATPTAVTADHTGVYRWVASYSGDGNNDAVDGTCADANQTTVVIKAATMAVPSVWSPTIAIGDQAGATATIVSGHSPTGSMTLSAYASADCAGDPVFTSTLAVNGNGNYPASPFTPAVAGPYRWIASYSGDDDNWGYTSTCGAGSSSFEVAKATPTVAATAGGPVAVGDDVDMSAALSGGHGATGTVAFAVYASDTCGDAPVWTSDPVAVTGDGTYGPATPWAPGAVGTYRVVASYSGDADNDAVASDCDAPGTVVEVTKHTAAVAGTATSGPLGGAVHDTATLSGATAHAGGTVTFAAYAGDTCTGTPAYTGDPVAVDGDGDYVSGAFTPTSPGRYRWVATYSGDDANAGAATSCGAEHQTSTVTQATLTLDPPSADLGSVTVGQRSAPRTFTATNTSSGVTAQAVTFPAGAVAVAGSGFALQSDGCSGRTIAPGASCTFAATFAPGAVGAAAGGVTVASDAAGSPAHVALAGTGVAPQVQLTGLTITRCMGTAKGAKRNVTLGYAVSAASNVTFTLQRRVKPPAGARAACPKKLPAGTPGAYVNVRGAGARAVARAAGAVASAAAAGRTHVLTTTVAVGAGHHTFALKTLLGSTKLKPGRYRVLVQVVSTEGARAQNGAYFWVLKPKPKKR